MRSPSFPVCSGVSAAVVFLSSSIHGATNLQIVDPQPRDVTAYDWFQGNNWDNGVPGPGDDVTMDAQSNESGAVDVEVIVQNQSVTVGSLYLRYGVGLAIRDANFAVAGTTDAEGFLSIVNGTLSLGTNVLYDPVTKTLDGGQCLVSDGGHSTQTIMEWEGADIVINKGGFNLFGTNAVVRDQNTGINAFENLERNEHFLVLDDGYVMEISGNFTNTASGSITLNLNQSVRTPELNIAGNFINDGEVELRGNTVMNVSGGLSGSGRILVTGSQNQVSVVGVYTQNGGEVNLGTPGGGSGIDSFTLKAEAQIYDQNAAITGSGTLEGNVTITSGSISPGASPGQVTVDGNLTLESGAVLKMEIGGTTEITQFDRIRQIDGEVGVNLGGELQISLIDGFYDEIETGDSFVILTSSQPLTGGFSNVNSGSRLDTTDGKGSFLVEYSGTEVVLSDFQVVSESFVDWIAGFEIPLGETDPLDDPNGDGVSNLEAYIRGMAPVGSGILKPLTSTPITGGLLVSLAATKAAQGVTVKTQISTNLTDWVAGPDTTVIDDSATRKLFQIVLPQGEDLPRFARFVFEEEEL